MDEDDRRHRTSGASASPPRWIWAAAVVAVVVLAAGAFLVFGRDGGGSDDAGSDDTAAATDPDSPPPSVAPTGEPHELVTIDLSDPAMPDAALEAGDVTLAVVPATVRPAEGLVILDAGGQVLSDPITPLLRFDVALPEIDPLAEGIAAALSSSELAALTRRVVDGDDAGDVASGWLADNGLDAVDPIDAPGPMRILPLDAPDLTIAAHLYGEVLGAAGFEVTYLEPVSDEVAAVGALRDREADLVVAGGRTLLAALAPFDGELAYGAGSDVRGALSGVGADAGVVANEPTAADRALRLVTTVALAASTGIDAVADLTDTGDPQRIGAEATCTVSPLCRGQLERTFGLRFAS